MPLTALTQILILMTFGQTFKVGGTTFHSSWTDKQAATIPKWFYRVIEHKCRKKLFGMKSLILRSEALLSNILAIFTFRCCCLWAYCWSMEPKVATETVEFQSRLNFIFSNFLSFKACEFSFASFLSYFRLELTFDLAWISNYLLNKMCSMDQQY